MTLRKRTFMTEQNILKSFSAFLLASIITACEPAPSTADLVLTNGKIYTVDKDIPWAEAIAIKDGRIHAIGADDNASAWIGADTKVIDLGGKLVLPAFGDAHIHPILGGMSFAQCSMHGDKSVEDYIETVANCVDKTPAGSVIYGRGWAPGMFPPDGIPRKSLLDKIAPNHPVIISSTGGHSLWLNSRALELAGITKDTADPLNGRIDRDPATGEPIGGLQEAAQDLMAPYIPAPTDQQMQDAILYAVNHMNSLGITNWLDAGIEVAADGTSQTINAYGVLKEQGKLTMNVSLALKWENEQPLEQMANLFAAAEHASTFGINADSVKFYMDGVLVQHTAAVLEPYINTNGERGKLQIPMDVFREAVSKFDAHGFQVYVHAIGDRAVRESLNAIEEARAKNGTTNDHHMIAHLSLVDPEDQLRFGELGVAANFQPLWACNHDYMRLTAKQVGEGRMAHTYPSNSILKAGGRIAYGADWPVASANPFEGLEVAVTRREPGKPDTDPLYENEAVTLAQAIRSYTIDVAHVTNREAGTGSLTTGKNADLIIVDQDIFNIPAHEISKTNVLLTLFRGNSVYGNWPE